HRDLHSFPTRRSSDLVMEFDRADKKGFAFRYDRQGGELCRFDFVALDHQMDHFRQVLEGIWTCLYEIRAQVAEYEAALQSEFGRDRKSTRLNSSHLVI